MKQENNRMWEQKCQKIDSMIDRLKTMKFNKYSDKISTITLEDDADYYRELLTEKRTQYINNDYESLE